MVPLKEEKEKNPLLIKVEPFCELPVDKEGFKGEIPEIPYLLPADNFQSYVDRKLYTHNCGHAVCAYLGDYKGYTYIAEAIKDPWIREKVEKAMKDETGQALIKKHQLTPSTHWQYVDDLIKRFGNVALKDTVFRVARDPWRKLGPHDRLIGAAKLTLKYQIIPHCICLATAAALYYFHPADPYSQKLKQVREKEGVDGILEKVCQINPTGELAKLIKEKISVLGLRSKK
jgi:mannitol-1-phosphate 5-dehydrogenase